MKTSRFIVLVLTGVLFAQPAQAQLLHYWNFTTDQNDVVGGALGSLNGPGASVSGGVLHLGGYESHGWVEFSDFLVPTSSPSTVSFFAKAAPESNGLARIISQGGSSGTPGEYGFYMGPWGPNNWLTDGWPYPNGPFYQDNEFHHYALTNSATEALFYIDGVMVDSHGPLGFTTGGTPTRFGRQFGSYEEFYNGDLDDIRIYGNALSATEVAEIANFEEVVTPEPGSMVLMATGLAIVAGVRRRKRNRA